MQNTLSKRDMQIRKNTRCLLRRISAATWIALLGLFANNAFADAVHDMCADPDRVCRCAASQLRAEVGDQDYALYEAISSAYLSNKNTGMNMVEAWDAAVKAESERQTNSFVDTLNRSNKIGRAHRKAIAACNS